MSAALDRRIRVYPRIAIGVVAVLLPVWWLLGDGWIDPAGKPVGGDYAALYTAGRMALEGVAAAAWDVNAHHPAMVAVLGGEVARLPFHYAPPLQLALALFATVPYGAALALWLSAGLAAWVAPLRMLRVDAREAGLLAASPAVLEGVLHGQTGGFVAALLGCGMLLVERRPWLGGALLGGLLFKPQYLAAPLFALLLARQGRALLAVAISVLAQALLCAVVLGPDVWSAFAHNVPFATRVLMEGGVDWWKLTTVTAGALQLGATPSVARWAQASVSVTAISAAAILWATGRGKGGAAAVWTAALLASPFAFGYDWMLLAPALLTVWRMLPDAGVSRTVCIVALVACWLAPLLHQGLAVIGVPLFGPLALGLLLAAITRIERRAP